MGGSEVDEKRIKEIKWADNLLIVSIRRGEEELIPDGDFLINSGDCLIVLADNDEAPLVKEELLRITSSYQD